MMRETKTLTVETTPKRTRGKPPWPHKALLRWTRGTSYPLSGPGSCRPKQDPLPYFTDNYYSFRQKHARRDIPRPFQTTCPTSPIE